MFDPKEIIRIGLSHFFVKTGITKASRHLFPKKGAVILYGHRVADDNEGYLQGLKPEWFEQQLAYLTSNYEIISLSELVQCLEKGWHVPQNSIVLTFDDGFQNNLEHGFPILEKYKVPATIFVVTGSISAGNLPWPQHLGVLFQQTSKSSISHSLLGNFEFNIQNDDGKKRAYLRVKEPMKEMGRDQRERTLDEFQSLLEVKCPDNGMLNWDDLKLLQKKGIEIGAHTFSHPFLAKISMQEARWELERSRDDLLQNLGIQHPAFCFPAGSFNGDLVQMVKELGFRCSFLPKHSIRVNSLENSDPFSLQRTGLPNGPAVQLEAELDGPFHIIRGLYRKKTGNRTPKGRS